MNEIGDQNVISAKMELILYGKFLNFIYSSFYLDLNFYNYFPEESYIRKLNEDFQKLKNLSKILDNQALNGKINGNLFFERLNIYTILK